MPLILKENMKYYQIILLIISFFSTTSYLYPYNFQQINSRDGLSNSAVICLFQDKERSLWIGTYDGLNKYNGIDIKIYKPDINDKNSLSGNVIRRIVESKDDYLWIMTRWGLNKYSKKKDKVEAHFNEFKEDCAIASDNAGNLFLLTQSRALYYYNFAENEFKKIAFPDGDKYRSWVGLIFDSQNRMCIVNNGKVKQFSVDWTDSLNPQLVLIGDMYHHEYITHFAYDHDKFLIVDRKGDLFIIKEDEKTYVKNIRPEIIEHGIIGAIVYDDNDIFIGFRTNGLIRLNSEKNYEIEKMPVSCGVFSLLKDDSQDILWVGTDGQGVYCCTKDQYVFNGIHLEELPIKEHKPVRAIYNDHYYHLWLGTKGNGIIKIENYENASQYNQENVEHFTVASGLSDNTVYAFRMSRYSPILWIGSNGPGLDYYSYDDKKIHTLKNNTRTRFTEVHCILEESDSILWVASLYSLLKVSIDKKCNIPETNNIRRYEFNTGNKKLSNQIYSICQENDSILWLSMRGNGAIRLNSISGDYEHITFEREGIAPMNDILSVYIDKNNNKWFGSSYGINSITQLPDKTIEYKNFNENDGLINNTIHGILENADGRLWLSSNAGIILFDHQKEVFRSFNQRTGLKVIEFSDNAYYKEERLSRYFFGGVDGVIWINHEEIEKNTFIPPINFAKIRLFNKEYNVTDFMVNKKGEDYLQLSHNQNFFTVTFLANDFINGANARYSYKLEEFNEVWINSNNFEAQFTNVPPGKYVLNVKYNDLSTRREQTASLHIVVLPPWYLSVFAKIIYSIIILLLLAFIYRSVKKRYEQKKNKIEQQLNQKYKEEMYENKLRFFTNITHEFCTPLTLIHIPCERILEYEKSDSFIKRYIQIIKLNSERLNNLVQEIIDFRRIETGHKICKIESCNINELCQEIMESFINLAEENHINFNLDITPAIIWNSDRSCIIKILNNLISNAFKYTPENGFINIKVNVEEEELVFRVHNTGEGIEKNDLSFIFNRYAVLDNVSSDSAKGYLSRNGLGLAICKSMVELLNGKIEVESEVGRYARFIVKLPAIRQTRIKSEQAKFDNGYVDNTMRKLLLKEDVEVNNYGSKENYPSILIIDDNEEILNLLEDILADEFNIITARNGNEGFETLTQMTPELIITDIMMPKLDGISLTKLIKNNPHTMHIPLIIVSAKSAINDKINGVESGADAYISKPFDIQYLRTLIKQLIEKSKKLKEYYNSPASASDFVNGQLIDKDDRDFIHKSIQILNRNINNIEFSPEDLADELQVSIRTLYRKFKGAGVSSPKDFIKEQRIVYAAKLMITSNLTIQEIMYNVGFTTRSHFYKEFTKRYNQSPKEYRENYNHELTE